MRMGDERPACAAQQRGHADSYRIPVRCSESSSYAMVCSQKITVQRMGPRGVGVEVRKVVDMAKSLHWPSRKSPGSHPYCIIVHFK